MSHTPHELAEEFPQHKTLIAKLKGEDAHFAKLVEEYHVVNRAVHRAETYAEPTSEEHEAEMRHRRIELKDEIYHKLSEAARAGV
ncbi:MAG: DUF465 domain-containing protein [Rhodobacteraceae bacterium]|nr:DUF465 domain-containing protein [Paracoccaceae bacterium]